MTNRPMEVQELIQALLNLNQPHARVVVKGGVTCYEDHRGTYEDLDFTQRVVDVRGEMNAVVLEVEA